MCSLTQACVLASLLLATFSSAQSLTCHTSTQEFDQKVDHVDSKSGTFKQAYQLNKSTFKPGGPILFYQGAETANISCIDGLVLPTWANETGGLAVTLEHRFFGNSLPSDSTNLHERFKSLTLDNVMLDAVEFIKFIKKTVPGSEDSPVIVTGASYGGFLSAVLRLNHPETFDGSIAWSPVTKGFGPKSQNPFKYNWYARLSEIYQERSFEASARIQKALANLISKYGNAYSYDKLTSSLNLCETPKTHSDLMTLRSHIVESLSDNAQYSFASKIVTGLPHRLGHTVEAVLAASPNNDLAVLNATVSTFLAANQLKCFDFGTGEAEPVGGRTDVFNYIQCKYVDYSTILIPEGTIFPTDTFPVSNGINETLCESTFGISPPLDQAKLEERYHFTAQELWDSDGILFTVGGIDPTAGLGPLELMAKMSPKGRSSTSIYWIDDAAHGEESFAPEETDKKSAVRAREIELETIKLWISRLRTS